MRAQELHIGHIKGDPQPPGLFEAAAFLLSDCSGSVSKACKYTEHTTIGQSGILLISSIVEGTHNNIYVSLSSKPNGNVTITSHNCLYETWIHVICGVRRALSHTVGPQPKASQIQWPLLCMFRTLIQVRIQHSEIKMTFKR